MQIVNTWRDSSRRWMLPSIIAIIVVGAVVYFPSLSIGFYTDDYTLIELAGRLSFADYWMTYFDPRLQWRFYRPMQGLQWWITYHLFHGDPLGYHVVQLSLHLLNTCLFFGLTRRITRRWQLALFAALVYEVIFVYNLAVFCPCVADPLVGVFYLLTILAWLNYLDGGKRRWFGSSFAAFIGALLSKEVAATLPVVLFLADRCLIAKPVSLIKLCKRYAPFVFALAIYGLFELNAVTHGVFTTHLGYSVGSHILIALAQNLAILAFPWNLPTPLNYAWLAVVLGLIGFAVIKRKRRVIFLVTTTMLVLAPILPFQVGMATLPRFLYLPMMGSAVGIALVFEVARSWGAPLQRRWVSWMVAAVSTSLLVWNGVTLAESASNFEGFARQTRMQFRPIFQAFPSFPQDTLLYFTNPPMESPFISGLMFVRYGKGIVTSGVDVDRRAGLANHNAAWILHQADEGTWQAIPVAKDVSARAAANLPARFARITEFDGFELTNDQVRRGQLLGLILYWRALTKIDQDYTVFVHLIDAQGQTNAGTDSQPRQGRFPTSAWRVNELVADGVIFPIDSETPPGEYKLQIGVYELATMQRLAIIDADGQAISDQIEIGPIWILE